MSTTNSLGSSESRREKSLDAFTAASTTPKAVASALFRSRITRLEIRTRLSSAGEEAETTGESESAGGSDSRLSERERTKREEKNDEEKKKSSAFKLPRSFFV